MHEMPHWESCQHSHQRWGQHWVWQWCELHSASTGGVQCRCLERLARSAFAWKQVDEHAGAWEVSLSSWCWAPSHLWTLWSWKAPWQPAHFCLALCLKITYTIQKGVVSVSIYPMHPPRSGILHTSRVCLFRWYHWKKKFLHEWHLWARDLQHSEIYNWARFKYWVEIWIESAVAQERMIAIVKRLIQFIAIKKIIILSHTTERMNYILLWFILILVIIVIKHCTCNGYQWILQSISILFPFI